LFCYENDALDHVYLGGKAGLDIWREQHERLITKLHFLGLWSKGEGFHHFFSATIYWGTRLFHRSAPLLFSYATLLNNERNYFSAGFANKWTGEERCSQKS
jgi:hypothetical protein